MSPSAQTLAPFDVHTLREREFPSATRAPYLNAAAVAPLPERAVRAVDAYNRRRASAHDLAGDDFEPTLARARQAAARLVGAHADEIALLPNTSFGINLAAHVLPLHPGRRVVVSDREFPANVYPWMQLARNGGAALDLVPADEHGRPDEARLLAEIERGDVGIFALSAVQFASGYNAVLERFGQACREHGTFFVVDAIQALGQVPVDVRAARVDVLATGGHKWLCGPFGTGFAYVRRELAAELEPRVVGWTAMAGTLDYSRLLDYRYEFWDTARRFEVATLPFQDVAGLTESMTMLDEVGPARIREHLLGLLDPLVGWIQETESAEIVSDLRPEHRSGIFCFRPRDAERAFQALTRAGVACVLREGAIRVSPHLYNTENDIAVVMEVLSEGW
ncbi:MAG: Cysteine desulfurase [uncultured Gemmatimonadetes bacterium]|uniref:Cysteine desulfurase n=1 Tax=uncultured Gemmatimonadota bacterium TaxID=203437 RepID=A0A6J4MV65_9BACT|nr:MAG: Cysteine desulfurase [uncultured Gemmatimonadota bacterium]